MLTDGILVAAQQLFKMMKDPNVGWHYFKKHLPADASAIRDSLVNKGTLQQSEVEGTFKFIRSWERRVKEVRVLVERGLLPRLR